MAGSSDSFAVETYLGRCVNYLDEMVDRQGLPYFNVFWTDPAEAAHDWPDYGDVTSRQLQAAVMVRRATGRHCRSESLWLRRVQALLSPEDGLLYRPRTPWSENVANLGDQALTLYALATVYADRQDPRLKQKIVRMVDGLHGLTARKDGYAWFPVEEERPGHARPAAGEPRIAAGPGFLIKPLTVCARAVGVDRAMELAGELTRGIFEHGDVFPDNTFGAWGHVHTNLRLLCGAADYAIAASDTSLLARIDSLCRFVQNQGTPFGFIPEVIGRKGDIVSCETCALMDYMGLMVTLANHGFPEWWAPAERLLRNQLVESQADDLSFLRDNDSRPDSDQFTWRNLARRMRGGWAGWTSPTHFLAANETLHWGADNLRRKTRLFQNCCGGSGAHALYIAWENAARFAGDTLQVNLHVDRALPESEIRSLQPYDGALTVNLKRDCIVRVRMPGFVAPAALQARSGSMEVAPTLEGEFANLGMCRKGETITLRWPLEERTEKATVGNPTFRQYAYQTTWRGETMTRIAPIGEPPVLGYSDFEQKQVRTWYGEKGPCRLYRREGIQAANRARPVDLHTSGERLGFW